MAGAGYSRGTSLVRVDGERADILVVDDLPEKLLVFETVLEELGQNLHTARSGEEALRAVLEREFAVILLDVNMPGLDGFETARLIRQRKSSAHTPIIFITAYADEMQTSQGYSLGAVDYILSPVVPEVLRAKVNVFVDLYHMRQRIKEQADERIALLQAEMARAAAEEATRRSTFLADAGRVLAGSLDVHKTSRELARLVIPLLGDVSTLVLNAEGEELPPGEIAYRDGDELCHAGFCPTPDSELRHVIDRVASTGTPEALSTIDGMPGKLRLTRVVPQALFLGRAVHSAVVMPLAVHGRRLGVWVLGLAAPERRFNAKDLALTYDLADRVAISIDNASLLAREQAARAELAQLNAELARSNTELDAFAYIASHDLKEPLRGIHNYAHFLIEDYADKLDEAGASKLKTLTRLTQRMQSLLDSLLHYSRLGRQELSLRPVNLQRVLDGALELLQARVEEAGVAIRVPRPLPTVIVDHRCIGEIFSNLIANAIKYNDKTERWVEIGYCETEDQSHPALYVKDNGIGIPEQHRDAIFRIFRRLHGREEYGGGVGAGLTIVKKIVERHGGRIWIESDVGVGTTFYFTLAPTRYHHSEQIDDPTGRGQ
ncbi:MAG: ATP-binding protein [Gammaproteobacteria bacterium]